MNTLDHVAAVLAKAEVGGVHPAELAALRRRLWQLGEDEAGRLPGDVLEPLPDLLRVD
jgi:UTP--glucose-1-phosphate uridylyltransferase